MSFPLLAGLTLLMWIVGIGGFILIMKTCGGCQKKQCRTQADRDQPLAERPLPQPAADK